jgi:hypothetical protein
MRALRDGRTLTYDQEPAPADGGRPASEAVIEEPEQPLHLGDGGVQSYYVLEGESAGTWIQAPAGLAHAAPADRHLHIRS